jgi:hypothetical protein
MEATLKQSGKPVIEVQVAEGSHIYLQGEDGQDVFIEWEDAPEMLRTRALEYRAKLGALFQEAAGSLFPLC